PRPDTLAAPPAAAAPARGPVWAGAARTVLSGEELRSTGETGLLAALAGRVPGLEVLGGGGEAGSAVAARIRGARAWAGGGPLLVVDGVPVAGEAASTWAGTARALAGTVGSDRAADVDLDEVESVEVLRGPAAAARFGVRGAGGAILVATRRGRPGRTEYSLRSAAGIERPARLVPLQRAYGLGAQGVSTACTAPNCAVPGAGFAWGPRLADGTPTFDHAAELFETGARWDNSLAVSGGSERTTFFLSGGVLAQDGYFTGGGDTYDRRSLRLYAEHRLRDGLTLGASAALVSSAGRYAPRAGSPGDLLQTALRTPPEFDNREFLTPEGLHRSFRFPNPRPGAELASRLTDNPFYLLEEGEYTQDVSRALGSFRAEWKPRPWLRVDYTLGGDRVADDRLEARPPQSSGAPAGGTVGSWRLEETRVEHSLAVAADWALGPALSGTLGAGHDLGYRGLRNVRAVRGGRAVPLPLPGAAPGSGGVTYDDRVRRTLDGYSLRGTLDVAGQLFLAGSLRNDGVAVSGEERHRAWYPAAGAAWSFARTLGIPAGVAGVGDLRLAWGRSGQEAGPLLLQDLLLFAPPPQGPGVGVALVSREDFRGASGPAPAVTDELEAGVDLALPGGRAELGVTWFRADTRGAALFLPRPTASGVRAENVGEVRNAGWEATLGLRPYTGRRVAVELGLNWARVRNRVTGLGGAEVLPYPFDPASFAGSRSVAQVGLPLGVVRGFDFARCGRGLATVRSGGITHDVGAACRGAPDGALFIAADGLPIRDPNERVIADPTPDWTGALSAELRVLGVRLGALVERRQGGEALNLTRAFLYQWGTHGDTETRGSRELGRDWMEGPVVGPGAGRVVRIDEDWFTTLGGAAGPRAQFVEDASVTRLREVSVAYTFDRPWLRRTLGLRAVDARVAGRNLRGWTGYTGFDPEAGVGGAVLPNRGIDWFVNPPARAWVISLTLAR
ncbi:MAG: TonB-dependent receptor plug domain-containing protein, partial [Gemmatimonadota bacterium]